MYTFHPLFLHHWLHSPTPPPSSLRKPPSELPWEPDTMARFEVKLVHETRPAAILFVCLRASIQAHMLIFACSGPPRLTPLQIGIGEDAHDARWARDCGFVEKHFDSTKSVTRTPNQSIWTAGRDSTTVVPQTDLSVGVLTVLDKGPWRVGRSVDAAGEQLSL